MRFKLILKLSDPLRNILPVNYQFELGSWFYRIINNSEGALYKYLVASGYSQKGEPFRNFVFSHLMVPDRRIEGDRLVIQSQRIGLIFSTIPDESIAPQVAEVFQGNHFLLGDRISQVPFLVEKVELLPEPEFTDKMTFKTLSPLHLTMKMQGRKNELFLSPETSGYARFFYENLHQKYKTLSGHDHPQDPLAGRSSPRDSWLPRVSVKTNPATAKNINNPVAKYLPLTMFCFAFRKARVIPPRERRYTINPDMKGAATCIHG